MSNDLDSIVQEFLVESHENLDQLDRDLVALEGDPEPQRRLASIFRTIHTIKGTCGFLGFAKLEKVSHVGENLLSRLRDGLLAPTPQITTSLLRLIDAVREMLAKIETTGAEGNADYSGLIATLTQLQEGTSDRTSDNASDTTSDTTFDQATEPAATSTPAAAPAASPSPDLSPTAPPPMDLNGGEASAEDKGPAKSEKSGDKNTGAANLAESAIRVDVKLLDKLMNLVGELVLARNQIQQYVNGLGDPQLLSSSQRLNLITTELQEGVMKTRMQPIGHIWSKFPRVVRDLALACGKQIVLEMDGNETELDKTLIEAVKDPLTHLVRNSVDHGIEPPEVRRSRGKGEVGHIWLRAFHEGGQVNIEITDDGGGIPPEKIKAKAVERGLITAEQAKSMSDRDAVRLIFLAGFSTAEKVTNVSGRGVGMDVVKTNIERIGGAVDVQSKPGEGTTIRVKIPLTLAIIPALMVGHAEARFAIPQVNLLELVRLEGADADTAIELVHGAPVYRLRGNLLPLVYLHRELGLADIVPTSQYLPATNIVVLQAEDRRFGLVVDQILDSAEIVVKPLDKRLHGLRAFAGATILGDGQLALILDILNIAKGARILSDTQQRLLSESNRDTETRRSPTRQTLLVFQADAGGRMAIPLSSITRLEEIPRAQIERAGNDLVVQYRGEILPLIDSATILGGASSFQATSDTSGDETDTVPVVVYTGNGKPCGLVVEKILDIVEQDLQIRGKPSRPGVQCTAVIQGRVTEVVDIATMLRSVEDLQSYQLAT